MKINRVLLNTFLQNCPDQNRCTGRTLGIALASIGAALQSPGYEIILKDHHDTRGGHDNLADTVKRCIGMLELKYIHLRQNNRGSWILKYDMFVEVDGV